MKFLCNVHATFAPATATSGGTYVSPDSTTYIVRVSHGGLWADKPQITCTTIDGSDISGPTLVPGSAQAVAVGTHGVTISFSGTGLLYNDKWYIEVVGQLEGPKRTLQLSNIMDPTIADGAPVDLTLYILQPAAEIAQDRLGLNTGTNWDVTEQDITVHAGLQALDPSWTSAGEPVALDVYSEPSKNYGILYVEYRAWLTNLGTGVHTITDPATLLTTIPGPLDPDNPLKWGLYMALGNANGVPVAYSVVQNPSDPDSWATMLGTLVGNESVYGLVPLTHNPDVLSLYHAHIRSQSTPINGLWRVAWFNLSAVPTIPIVATSSTIPGHEGATTVDGKAALCIITQNPDDNDSLTLLRCTSANANFVTNGVLPNDVVHTEFTIDALGNPTYTSYLVDHVLNEEELILQTAAPQSITVGVKTEVWRNLNADDEAAQIAAQAAAYGDRRIRAVWPDSINAASGPMDGVFGCCALAAESGGILPHQGMTNLPVLGFTSVPRTTRKFGGGQLDTMANSGCWIITQNPAGVIYTRHALTCGDQTSVLHREEMSVRNADSISYAHKRHFAPFIGIANVTPTMLTLLRTEETNLINVLKTANSSPTLGTQIISGTIVSVAQDLVAADQINMVILVTMPAPLNQLRIHLVF